jgi:hypothetical protein
MGIVYMPRPVIGFKRYNMSKLVAGSEVVQGKFAANSATLSNPPVSPAAFETQITDLKAKHLATKTNKAAVPAREAAANIVWATCKSLCAFTLQLCYASPEQASTIIAASGFKESGVGTRQKETLELFLTTNPGEIRCEANASKLEGSGNRKAGNRDYHWRYGVVSTPVPGAVAPVPVPAAWINDEATPVARTLITGIPPLTYVAVQVAVKDSVGRGAWSQSVIILVTR